MLFHFALVVCFGFLNVIQPAALLLGAETGVHEDRAGGVQSEKPLTACGPLRRPGTRFVLQNDVESAGTCFSIEADHVSLDLHGHTVTYGTSDGGKPTFAVLAADCWYEPIRGNSCGGSHRYPEVLNGKIVQGAAAAPMSHALRFGQANNVTGISIHDLDITVHAQDSIAIYTEYLPGGSDIYGNTIHNHVTVISSRTQFRGASIKLDEESAAKLPDKIHHNVIVGGAQLGIRDDNPAGTKIFANDISQDATYTNGFCIDAAGAGMQVFGNKCHPVHGRGIHSNQSGVQIYDNVVETIDSDRNQEYKGCEINGTYGIQVESDNFVPTGIRIYGNHVKVHAAACPAEAMRLTDLKDARIEISNNEFVAVRDPVARREGSDGDAPPPGARGFSVGNVRGREILFTGNTVQADTAMFYMDWDGGGSLVLRNNKFRAGTVGNSSALLAEFGNGTGPSEENFFEDNTYEGFSPEAARFGDYSGNSWFAVTKSFAVHVVDEKGSAIKGAQIKTAIATGEIAASLTDAEGNARLVLPLARMAHNQPNQTYEEHRLTIEGLGCQPETVVLKTTGPSSIVQTLNCR